MRLSNIYCNIFPGGERYVGKAYDVDKRQLGHKHDANVRKSNTQHHNAIRKYMGAYETIILAKDVPDIFIGSFEKYWIHKFDTFRSGLNMTEGGDGGITYRWTEEQKRNHSQKLTGRKRPEHAKFMREHMRMKRESGYVFPSGENNAMWGKKHTQETKKKWSKTRKGKTIIKGCKLLEKSLVVEFDRSDHIICPHCNKTFLRINPKNGRKNPNILVHHFDRCKLNDTFWEEW
jgi:group I intron endonuclease